MPDTTYDQSGLERYAAGLAASLRPGDAVLLRGPLGAGKTVFCRALIRAACQDPGLEVPSPTYTLVQSYDAPRFTVHHFDLWRLRGPQDLAELGWDEARAGVVLVEWPDRLEDDAPREALHLTVAMVPGAAGTGQRLVTADDRRVRHNRADDTMTTRQMSAILLAAGYGSRMRPLTDALPKPLLLLDGRSLLDRALDRLADACIERVVVNAFWHADRLRTHLAERATPPPTTLRTEGSLLDTAGAVIAARADGLLGSAQPIFVVNGDTVWLDGPLPTLARLAAALSPDLDAVILVHRTFQIQADVGLGDFFLDPFGRPRRRGEREVAPYLYAGVTLARPELFEGWPPGSLSMNSVWDRAILAGRLMAVVHDGLWFHLTRPGDLAEAEHALTTQLTGPTT